jgi:hypothetical protein
LMFDWRRRDYWSNFPARISIAHFLTLFYSRNRGSYEGYS